MAHPQMAAPASTPRTAPARTVADVVGETLAAQGVRDVFGLLGSGNMVVTEALVARGATLHHSRLEAGAITAADGYARVSGRPGVVSVHQGPGLTNTMTGLTEAAKSRTPLLVLAGETPAAALTSNFRIDQHGLVESVGAIAERLHSPETAADDALTRLRARADRAPPGRAHAADRHPGPAARAVKAEPSAAAAPLRPRPAIGQRRPRSCSTVPSVPRSSPVAAPCWPRPARRSSSWARGSARSWPPPPRPTACSPVCPMPSASPAASPAPTPRSSSPRPMSCSSRARRPTSGRPGTAS